MAAWLAGPLLVGKYRCIKRAVESVLDDASGTINAVADLLGRARVVAEFPVS
jgi:hypothetical protein